MVNFPAPDLTPEKVDQAISFIINILAEPRTEVQSRALTAFWAQDYAHVKRLSMANPNDHYCEALGYLGSARQPTLSTDALLLEAVKATAEHVRDGVATRLGTEIARILDEQEDASGTSI